MLGISKEVTEISPLRNSACEALITFVYSFVLVPELLRQAVPHHLASPLLLKPEDGVFSLPILPEGQIEASI